MYTEYWKLYEALSVLKQWYGSSNYLEMTKVEIKE